MNQIVRVFTLVVLLIYVISPVDLVPGPIDDMILIIVHYLSKRKLSSNKA